MDSTSVTNSDATALNDKQSISTDCFLELPRTRKGPESAVGVVRSTLSHRTTYKVLNIAADGAPPTVSEGMHAAVDESIDRMPTHLGDKKHAVSYGEE